MPVVIPKVSTDRLTPSISPVELPLVGLTLSQGALSLIDQLSIPLPEFPILNVWFGGLGSSCSTLKLKLKGLTAMAEGDGGACFSHATMEPASRKANPRSENRYHLCLFVISVWSFMFSVSKTCFNYIPEGWYLLA